MRWLRIVLIIVAVACFGVALSYPIRYRMAQESNNSNMEQLAALREKGRNPTEESAASPEAGADRETGEPAEGTEGAGAPESDAVEGSSSESAGGVSAPGINVTEPSSDGAEVEAASRAEPDESPSRDLASGPGTDDTPAGQASGFTDAQAGAEAASPEGGDGSATDPTGAVREPATADAAQPPREGEVPATAQEDARAQGDSEPPSGSPGNSDIPEGAQGDGGTSAEDLTDGGAPTAADQAMASAGSGGDANVPNASEAIGETGQAATQPTPADIATPTPPPTPTPTPGLLDWIMGFPETPSPTARVKANASGDASGPVPEPTPTPDRRIRTGALPYPMLEKVELDLDAMLPELKEIYELNHDLVGWLTIPNTVIDYPVVQCEDREFYLDHDFYGEENVNGQIILDTQCDPYTPSYNLVISGHHMKNGSMFGELPMYASKGYWASHKFVEFDTLMARKQYVIFAAFYSADYDEDEEGFRYSADIQYKIDMEQWLAEVRENQLYDTEVDVKFGDEVITLTTCNKARHKNGRFVVVCRRIREGETFE